MRKQIDHSEGNDDHIFEGDAITALSQQPLVDDLPEEAFAPPPSPEQLGPTAFGFEGEPSAFVKDVLQ